jgi:hypothetical protein
MARPRLGKKGYFTRFNTVSRKPVFSGCPTVLRIKLIIYSFVKIAFFLYNVYCLLHSKE